MLELMINSEVIRVESAKADTAQLFARTKTDDRL